MLLPKIFQRQYDLIIRSLQLKEKRDYKRQYYFVTRSKQRTFFFKLAQQTPQITLLSAITHHAISFILYRCNELAEFFQALRYMSLVFGLTLTNAFKTEILQCLGEGSLCPGQV